MAEHWTHQEKQAGQTAVQICANHRHPEHPLLQQGDWEQSCELPNQQGRKCGVLFCRRYGEQSKVQELLCTTE